MQRFKSDPKGYNKAYRVENEIPKITLLTNLFVRFTFRFHRTCYTCQLLRPQSAASSFVRLIPCTSLAAQGKRVEGDAHLGRPLCYSSHGM